MERTIHREFAPGKDNFVLTPEEVTKLAQDSHNYCDENGDVSEGKLIQYVLDTVDKNLWQWLEGHIDFDKIRDDDRIAREFYEEKMEAMKGEY